MRLLELRGGLHVAASAAHRGEVLRVRFGLRDKREEARDRLLPGRRVIALLAVVANRAATTSEASPTGDV